MPFDFPETLANRVHYVAKYIGDETTDWIRVKKELLNALAPKDRSFFSRRHKTSKKHFVNDFEKEVMKFWETLTGIQLQIDPQKLHTPQDERPPRHWALMELNKQRQEAARNKNENG